MRAFVLSLISIFMLTTTVSSVNAVAGDTATAAACPAGSAGAAPLLSDQERAPLLDRAIEKGLAWLAGSQQEDGSWPGANSGVVASCALAVMAHGYLPRRGAYGPTVAKAIDFLLTRRTAEGALYNGGEAPMYQHGLATLALIEVFGEMQDPRLRPTILGAIELMVRVQNPQGGWRHALTTTDGAELPGSVVQLMALRAAQSAGFAVPTACIDQGVAYVRACQSRVGAGGDGGFMYDRTGASNWSRTGCGIAALQMAGRYFGAEIHEAMDYLQTYEPIGTRIVPERMWWHFGAYYSCLAMYLGQNRGEHERALWDRYRQAMERRILAEQQPDGSWRGDRGAYPSAMYLLIMALPKGYLPIQQF